MATPLSLIQAKKICQHYHHLRGRPLLARADLREPIVYIVISPHDELNKWIFLQNFSETQDNDRALEFYQPPYYDVLLLAKFRDKNAFYYQDLRSYCADTGIDFNINKFTTCIDPAMKEYDG